MSIGWSDSFKKYFASPTYTGMEFYALRFRNTQSGLNEYVANRIEQVIQATDETGIVRTYQPSVFELALPEIGTTTQQEVQMIMHSEDNLAQQIESMVPDDLQELTQVWLRVYDIDDLTVPGTAEPWRFALASHKYNEGRLILDLEATNLGDLPAGQVYDLQRFKILTLTSY